MYGRLNNKPSLDEVCRSRDKLGRVLAFDFLAFRQSCLRRAIAISRQGCCTETNSDQKSHPATQSHSGESGATFN